MSKLLFSCGSKVSAWAATAKKKIANAKHMFQSNRSAKEMERALAKLPAGFRLTYAISKGDVGTFKSLISENPCLAQHHTGLGTGFNQPELLTINRIVCSATAEADPHKEEMILYALEKGADINARLHGKGWTALESAVYSRNIRLIPFLIKHGARPVDGEGDDVLKGENFLQEIFKLNRYYLGIASSGLLLEIVDSFASIGLVNDCSNPKQVLIEFNNSDPLPEIYVAVVNRLVQSGLRTDEVQFDLCWLWRLINEKIDDSFDLTVLQNNFIEDLSVSGFELTDQHDICNTDMISIPSERRPAIKELILQFSAAKASVQARKEKENILRELAIASEDIEVRPRRRM
ncbi:ankyrin repeat domain-containing protein [Stenotrophomonas sp. GD03654]|uniref:ankyrin repeat domain-containing protein n=1 Tax=Stenotrophomonas sp. GD03654 TaxID=2975362 RepID=UPI00244AFA73|nr:ankyrin repeat domain-containing protein [Stenotrophomonas sp. GD03654]MDH2177916.1 ankyrin repeat domain-containing protein [Stenotrophomonas sp. GD03654]